MIRIHCYDWERWSEVNVARWLLVWMFNSIGQHWDETSSLHIGICGSELFHEWETGKQVFVLCVLIWCWVIGNVLNGFSEIQRGLFFYSLSLFLSRSFLCEPINPIFKQTGRENIKATIKKIFSRLLFHIWGSLKKITSSKSTRQFIFYADCCRQTLACAYGQTLKIEHSSLSLHCPAQNADDCI